MNDGKKRYIQLGNTPIYVKTSVIGWMAAVALTGVVMVAGVWLAWALGY